VPQKPVITSPDNQKLKEIRKLARSRKRTDRFIAEGEDLVGAGWEPEYVLRAGIDVDEKLLADASTLGSGTRMIGVYRERWSEPGGTLSVWLDGVKDPGNIGTIMRSAHALCDGPVVIGPRCADPFGARAVRASMGSIFARPPARSELDGLPAPKLALVPSAGTTIAEVALEPPLVICLGGEREGLPAEVIADADWSARIPLRVDGPESLNVAMAATVALYEVANRMAGHA
jgi:RNA methyltransferase, TrmH family